MKETNAILTMHLVYKYFPFRTLVAITLIGLISCKKETVDRKDEVVKASYKLAFTEVLPMQLVGISSSIDITEEKLFARIGPNEVELIKVDNRNWNFLCPMLPSNHYTIMLEGKFELAFEIKPYSQIQDPEKVLDDFEAELGALRTSVGGSVLKNKGELEEWFSYYQSAITEVISGLTFEEKVQLAYFIRSNGYEKSGFDNQFNNNLPDSFLSKASLFDPTDATDRFIISFASARFHGIVATSISLAMFWAPEPTGVTKAIAGAAAIVALADLAILYKLIDNDLSKLLGRVLDIDVLNKKAFEFNLYDNEILHFDAVANFGNFTNNDRALGIFPSLFSGLDELNQIVEKFYSAAKNVKSWFFATQPTHDPKLFLVGNNLTQKRFFLNAKYVSLTQSSNPDIKVELIKNGNQLQLKATSTTIKTKTNFKITLKYDQANVNHSSERVFDAIYHPESYVVLNAKNERVIGLEEFTHNKSRTFYLSKDLVNKATGIDYAQISVKNISNQLVDVVVGYSSSAFTLKLMNKDLYKQTVLFEIHYKGIKVQSMVAEVLPDCSGLSASLSRNGKVISASASGGQSPYLYSFNGKSYSSNPDHTLTNNGGYRVVVKDANGCTDTVLGVINDISNLSITTSGCAGGAYIKVSYQSSLGLLPDFISYGGPSSALFFLAEESVNLSTYKLLNLNTYCVGQSTDQLNGVLSIYDNQDIYNRIFSFLLSTDKRCDEASATSLKFRLPLESGSKICTNGAGINFSGLYSFSW